MKDDLNLYDGEERPWGYYINLYESENYKVKKILVKPKEELSLQLHHKRAEHWIGVSGEGEVTVGDKKLILKRNEHVFIPVETMHRVSNRSDKPFIFIEVQVGDYLGEDDIVRFEDKYGRAK